MTGLELHQSCDCCVASQFSVAWDRAKLQSWGHGCELLPNKVRELEPCDLHVPVKIKFLLDLVTIFSSSRKQVLSCLKSATPKMRPRATCVTQKWKLYALSSRLVLYSSKKDVAEALVPNTSISAEVANPHEHIWK